jgi:hypothetical protein
MLSLLLSGLLAAAAPPLAPVASPLAPLGEGVVVVAPERDAPEYWAGAPSVLRDGAGVFWLACRMRTPDAPRGQRGHSLRILRGTDGVGFEEVLRIPRASVPVPGFERPALLLDPESGRFKLYGCGAWEGRAWSIFKLDDVDDPADFDPSTARRVIAPLPKGHERDVIPVEYKDPVILHDGTRYHAYLIGYLRQNERIYHFTSPDGEVWAPEGNPYASLLPLDGWHDFFIRPASVVRAAPGWLFFYEGSHGAWHDPVYNLATGLAYTFDLHRLIDLTPDAPLWVSPTPSATAATFRYVSALPVDGALWIYAEVVRPSGAHDIRRFILPR